MSEEENINKTPVNHTIYRSSNRFGCEVVELQGGAIAVAPVALPATVVTVPGYLTVAV